MHDRSFKAARGFERYESMQLLGFLESCILPISSPLCILDSFELYRAFCKQELKQAQDTLGGEKDATETNAFT